MCDHILVRRHRSHLLQNSATRIRRVRVRLHSTDCNWAQIHRAIIRACRSAQPRAVKNLNVYNAIGANPSGTDTSSLDRVVS